MSQQVEPRSPSEVARAVAAGVSRLVVGGLSPGEREQQLDRLAELYAEVTDVRHPFTPTGDVPLRTRPELREHFATASLGDVERFEPVDPVVHITADAEVVVFEFAYAITARGVDFVVPCIFVIRVRNGRIVESRDYTHHVAMARGLGKLDALATALTTADQR